MTRYTFVLRKDSGGIEEKELKQKMSELGYENSFSVEQTDKGYSVKVKGYDKKIEMLMHSLGYNTSMISPF